jgi:peptidoglycan/LPS O-acetylase OafA/YrhL
MLSSIPKSQSRIDELDGLRGLLALWVAVSHIFCWCGFSNLPNTMLNCIRNAWIRFSYASGAVDTFIILSGFVISFLLHTRPQSYRQFLTARFFRIYPVYLACLLLGFGAAFLAPFILENASWRANQYFLLYQNPSSVSLLARPFSYLATHLTLLFGLIPEKILPFTAIALLAPAWSISLEWQYYMIAPLLARLICTRTGLIILGLVGWCDFIYSHFWSDAFLPAKLPLFLVGIGSYHLYAEAYRFVKFKCASMVVIAVLVAVITFSWHWIALAIWTLVFGGLLVGQADFNDQDEWVRWLLCGRQVLLHPALQKLGHLSYPLYLIHWPLIIFLLSGLLRWRPQATSFEALSFMVVLGTPVMLLTAWLLHTFVESPMIQWSKKSV